MIVANNGLLARNLEEDPFLGQKGRKIMAEGKKGIKGATLTQQIDKLEKLVGPDGIGRATIFKPVGPMECRLSVKYLGKNKPTPNGLTKAQMTDYNTLLGINKEVAEKWRSGKLVENTAKRASKKVSKAIKVK